MEKKCNKSLSQSSKMKIVLLVLMISITFISIMSCNNQNKQSSKMANNKDNDISKLLLSEQEYVDPKGFFSMFPPNKWTIKEFPNDSRGKVHFSKNKNNNLMILVKAIPQNSFQELYDYCNNEGKEKLISMGVSNLEIYKQNIGKFVIIKRNFDWQGSKSLMIDYYLDGVNHNLYYSAPANEYNKYINTIEASIISYIPKFHDSTPDERKSHNLQSRKRVAKLLFDMGDYKQSYLFIADGLTICPDDPVLLELKKEIEKRINNK